MEDTSVVPAAGVVPNDGQTWRSKSTGKRVTLVGLKRAGWVTRTNHGVVGAVIAREALEAKWEWVSCDHGDACCTSHSIHVSPHRACVLR